MIAMREAFMGQSKFMSTWDASPRWQLIARAP